MSWAAILALAGGAYLFKALGLLVFGPMSLRNSSDNPSLTGDGQHLAEPLIQRDGLAIRLGQLLPPALLAALVVSQTVVTDQDLVIDARLAGVAAGAISVWRGAPFWLVLVIAASVTALVRLAM